MNIPESIYKEPEKWQQKEHTFNHESGVRIWTANVPFLNLNTHPECYMSWSMKWKIYRAIKWWANNAPLEAFAKG